MRYRIFLNQEHERRLTLPSLTEQLEEESSRKAKESAKATYKAQKKIKEGIALILNTTILSEDSIMKALDKKVDKTGNLDFSYANLSLEELQKHGKVKKVEEPILKESMKYFDRYCREYNVKYSALERTVKGDDGKEQTGYIIFFKGKDDKIIEEVIKQAVKDWTKDKQKAKDIEKEAMKDSDIEKPSVLAKLAFFRSRVKEFVEQDKSTQNEKTKTKQQDLER